jgi:Uma2 family endonuclease
MSAVTTLPWGRPLTRHDLHDLPDDGHRYELLDGMLLVSPSPTHRHQRAASRLVLLLGNACPADRELLFAPFDVVLADDTVLQPDILVASARDLEDERLPLVPHLVVEVLPEHAQGRSAAETLPLRVGSRPLILGRRS